jgi:hypothetical protein
VQFPYDNLCDSEQPPQREWAGAYNITLLSGETLSITVARSDESVYCHQSWKATDGLSFPATSRWQDGKTKWMTDSQVTLTDIYGWSTVFLVALWIVVVFGGTLVKFFVSFFHGTYKVRACSDGVYSPLPCAIES